MSFMPLRTRSRTRCSVMPKLFATSAPCQKGARQQLKCGGHVARQVDIVGIEFANGRTGQEMNASRALQSVHHADAVDSCGGLPNFERPLRRILRNDRCVTATAAIRKRILPLRRSRQSTGT